MVSGDVLAIIICPIAIPSHGTDYQISFCLSVCVCVCVCTYVYVRNVHTYVTYIRVHTCTYVYIRVTYVRMYTYVHVRVHVRTYTHTYTYIHTYIHTYIDVRSSEKRWMAKVDVRTTLPRPSKLTV